MTATPDPVAIVILAASWGMALLTAFVLRTRLPAVAVAPVLAACGGGLAVGGLLLREDPSAFESVFSIVALVVLVPAHVRIVLGRFGPGGSGPRG